MRLLFVFFYFFSLCLAGFAQTLPPERSVDWTLAGLRDATTSGFVQIDMQTFGAIGDGVLPNDSIISNALSSTTGPGAILQFPSGNFLFNNTIVLPSNVIIRGQGPGSTTFTMSLGGAGVGIDIRGSSIDQDTTSFVQSAVKDSIHLFVLNTAKFSIGDWVQIIQLDTDLVTSSWAKNTVGQIVKIEDIVSNKIVLASPLRMDYDITRSPYIRKIDPVQNVGIECLKIHRTDDTAPQQTSNVFFRYAVNCWVTGIESENCTYSHIEAQYSSNLYISKSYMHHAFDYGSGGRAYGVILHFTTNECRVENNIFEHLRHSMIVQAGANGNVFAYNYSLDPFWSSNPNDAAGDIVLHGNYPYSNLFEQNICRNIVIDNSHGLNGPYNTFFRNRAEGFGIFFSGSNSPNQNLLGNDIPNLNSPYSLVNYTIQGTGHFIHGNNNKGTISPQGTNVLPDSSYAYTERPDFVPSRHWAAIGTPNLLGAATIPARDRYKASNIFGNSCGNPLVGFTDDFEIKEEAQIFPNPIKSEVTIESKHFIINLTITDGLGRVLQSHKNIGLSYQIDTQAWVEGTYYIIIRFSNNNSVVKRAIKIN